MRLSLGVITYLAVCLAWVFFRADTFGRAWQIVQGMFGWNGVSLGGKVSPMVFLVVLLTLVIHWWMRDRHLETTFGRLPAWLQGVLMAVFLMATFIAMTGGRDNAFIYFQF